MTDLDLISRFLSEYAALLDKVERTLKGADSTSRRRAAVRLLNDRLADRFSDGIGSRMKGSVENATKVSLRAKRSNPSSALSKNQKERLLRSTLQILDQTRTRFAPYPFSIREAISSDVITPEILGRTVEQFAVDQTRHGAWYTPAPVVTFICRETVRLFLGVSLSEAARLSLDRRMSLLDTLTGVRIIDPACGCGAFLMGMVHELLRWRSELLPHNPSASPGNFPLANLYGTDLDDLAVHTARLRLALEPTPSEMDRIYPGAISSVRIADGLDSQTTPAFDGTFDIVVTNPPFGLTVAEEVRNRFFDLRTDGPQSKDAYGLFVARGLELLRKGGVMGVLMSDTWRTIKRHRPLRQRLLATTTVHTLADLPLWIFPATVNTGILLLTNSAPAADHALVTADLRYVPKNDWGSLTGQLDVTTSTPGGVQQAETPAIYVYPQSQIATCENLSFFIGSPKLHTLLSDPRLTTLGELATVKQGLATGDNKRYLRKLPAARGSYQLVDPATILSVRELGRLSRDEKLTGVDPEKYNGRHFVPYDKGGASDSDQGWLPNYYVPTEYFIDWSKPAVQRMKTARSARRRGKLAGRFQNSAYYFKRGLTFSYTGYYAPCFRLSSGGVFDVGGSSCFDIQLPLYPTLAILASKVVKYFARNFIDHTVNFQVGEFKALPVPRAIDPGISARLETLVTQIVENQHSDPRYPYHLHEQIEIDRLVYQLFDLTDEDVREVESWYGRRYARLSKFGST
jgi:hypothetical protein